MAFNAEAATLAYRDRMASAATKQKYIAGIDATTVNPMEAAAAADQKFLDRVSESVTSGRRAAKLRSIPKSVWAERSKTKGAERLSSGAAAAVDKVRANFNKMAPVYDEIKSTIRNMPNNSEMDALERVRYVMQRMKAAAGKS